MAVVMVLAHEYGHALQISAGIATEDSPALVTEQQADCLAGGFLRHVAEGDSRHFTLNTTEGLNGVLGATVAVRDRDPDDPDNVHGSAFERVTAVQMGYTNGAEACAQIDALLRYDPHCARRVLPGHRCDRHGCRCAGRAGRRNGQRGRWDE